MERMCKKCGKPGVFYREKEIRDGKSGHTPVFECRNLACLDKWKGDWKSKHDQSKEYIEKLRKAAGIKK